jgi:hypothetical protein
MLIYYLILIIIFGSGIGVYLYKNYAYRIYDSQYDIPYRSSFDYLNCQLDGSCLTPFSQDPTVPPMPKLRPPIIGKNRICLKSPYVSIHLPEFFFNKKYGCGILP